MQELVDLLIQNNISLSSCESFTGGLFASSITSYPGVSKIFKGSIIAYQNEIKRDVLKIDDHIFKEFGVISDKMAIEMAVKSRELFKSDLSVSFTGNAGPSNLENKPVGVWYLGLAYKDNTLVYEFNDSGTRESIRLNAVRKAFEILHEIIRNY
ncbi:MAG TPA: CinA family protein [Erysipelotrichaceae bacterium]|nr:CinA family protein [Erysipelotrichaceae bacterium]